MGGAPVRRAGLGVKFVQDNQSRSVRHILRGLHYQIQQIQGKFVYRCTDFWAPAHERAIIWNDPDLKVSWPLPPEVEPILSAKDTAAVRFRDAEHLP